jgi:hypothetical protein
MAVTSDATYTSGFPASASYYQKTALQLWRVSSLGMLSA